MVYGLRIQPSEINELPTRWLEQAIAAAKAYREEQNKK